MTLLPRRFETDITFDLRDHPEREQIMLALSPTSPEQLQSHLATNQFDPNIRYAGYGLLEALNFKTETLEDYEQCLNIALNYGVNPNVTDIDDHHGSGTSCHTLIANENFDRAAIFLDVMKDIFDPSLRDRELKTILIIASKIRAQDLALQVLDLYGPEKCDINAQDENNCTALHYAYALNLPELIASLKELGAREDLLDHKGRAPRDYLNLSIQETRQILESIEIHPDRDLKAPRNAIRDMYGVAITNRSRQQTLASKRKVDQMIRKPQVLRQYCIMCIADDMGIHDSMAKHMYPDLLNRGMTLELDALKKFSKTLSGLSVIDNIMKDRYALKAQFAPDPENGEKLDL